MDSSPAAIEMTAVHWEQWIGATLRAERFRTLLAAARRPHPRAKPVQGRKRARGSLLWMLAVSAAGFWLLR